MIIIVIIITIMIIIVIIIIIIIIILYSNKWTRRGFTKYKKTNKQHQINLQTGKLLINMPIQLLN